MNAFTKYNLMSWGELCSIFFFFFDVLFSFHFFYLLYHFLSFFRLFQVRAYVGTGSYAPAFTECALGVSQQPAEVNYMIKYKGPRFAVHRLLSVDYLNLPRKFTTAKMLMLQSSIDEESLINFENDSEINILAAATAFTRSHLHQNQCYLYECSLSACLIATDEFGSHLTHNDSHLGSQQFSLRNTFWHSCSSLLTLV